MPKNAKPYRSRKSFLARNLGRGIFYLALLIAAFIILKKYFNVDYYKLLEPTFDQTFIVYAIFSVSEVAFGIIPPEIFFIWASAINNPGIFVGHIVLLSILSYLAGILGYFIGKTISHTSLYQKVERRFLQHYRPLLRLYGTFVVIVAAITPLPFSGISMLVGTVRFGFRKYLLAASFRFLRFAVYGLIIWEANQI